ncbi:hypothetical protein JW933_11145 [candidate division FCPU426 bacterium]|nr:hypothetical protein [candidate division FCPU426 bacterium]
MVAISILGKQLLKRLVWFGRTAAFILQHPLVFFRALPAHGIFRDSLCFVALAALAGQVWIWILQPAGLLTQWPVHSGLTPEDEMSVAYITLPLMPFLIYAAFRLVGGRQNFVQAVGVVCYASAYLILPPLAWAGYFFELYGMVLLFLAAKEVSALSVRRAFLAFGLFLLLDTAATLAVLYGYIKVLK